MLFTPSPPLSSQSVSSSVESDSSPTHIASTFNNQNVESQRHTLPLSTNATLVANGPSNNQLLSNSQTRLSQLHDQDYFYSPLSSSSSSHPSIHLTPTKTPTNFRLFKSQRRDSCPVSPKQKRSNRFHLPTNITSSIRNVLMASMPHPDPHNHHIEDKSHVSRAHQRSNSTIMPVANPVAAATLVEDMTNDEQLTKSLTPSPIGTPKISDRISRSPTFGSTYLYPINNNNNSSRKVTLNVGGVRHEGNLFIYSFFLST